MGDRSQSELYTALLDFLEQHGRLVLEGVAERGMPISRALEFIGLLSAHQVPIDGLEIWRGMPDGYRNVLPWIWASRVGRHHDYPEVLSWLDQAELQPEGLIAVQFG